MSEFLESNYYAFAGGFSSISELDDTGSPSATTFVARTRVQRLAPLPLPGLHFPTRSKVEYTYCVADHLTGEELVKTRPR